MSGFPLFCQLLVSGLWLHGPFTLHLDLMHRFRYCKPTQLVSMWAPLSKVSMLIRQGKDISLMIWTGSGTGIAVWRELPRQGYIERFRHGCHGVDLGQGNDEPNPTGKFPNQDKHSTASRPDQGRTQNSNTSWTELKSGINSCMMSRADPRVISSWSTCLQAIMTCS